MAEKAGDGTYASASATLEITVSPRDISPAVITLSGNRFTYTGAAIEPAVTSVVVDGITVPLTGLDITYADNTGAGTSATVTVAANALSVKFTGSASTTFEISAPVTSSDDGDSPYTPPQVPAPTEQWMTAANLRNPSRSSLKFGVRASAWDALTGKYYHDSLRNGIVEVRAYFDDPSLFTKDSYVSGWVSGTAVTSIRGTFGKWFKNQIRTIHFDQAGRWEKPIQVAARVDLAGMDTKRLAFYAYDPKTNTYKRIETPEYWIDANGYLHFTTEYAGEIIIAEGELEKK
jgi:hypothetical protein